MNESIDVFGRLGNGIIQIVRAALLLLLVFFCDAGSIYVLSRLSLLKTDWNSE